MTEREEQVNQAYQEVLGRDADPSGLAEYSKYGDMDRVKRLLAMSDEGRNNGVDATNYGAVYADPGNMSSQDRQYYDTFEAHRKGPIYEDEVKLWSSYAGTPRVLEATLRGGVANVTRAYENSDGTTGYSHFKVLTEEGVRILGDDIHKLSGANAGETWVMPEGTNFGADNFVRVKDSDTGLQVWTATGNPTDGLFGFVDDTLGTDFAAWIPKEMWLPVDVLTLGFGTPILGGSEAKQDAVETFGSITGMSDEHAAQTLGEITAVVRTIVQIVAFATGVGAPVGAMLATYGALEQHAMGQSVEWGNVAAQMALNSVPGMNNPFVNAAVSAGYQAIEGGDSGDLFVAAAAGFAGAAGGDIVDAVARAGQDYYQNKDTGQALMMGAGGFLAKGATRTSQVAGGLAMTLADGQVDIHDMWNFQSAAIPQYKRDSVGNVLRDGDGNKIPAGHTYRPMSGAELLDAFKDIPSASGYNYVAGRATSGYGYAAGRVKGMLPKPKQTTKSPREVLPPVDIQKAIKTSPRQPQQPQQPLQPQLQQYNNNIASPSLQGAV